MQIMKLENSKILSQSRAVPTLPTHHAYGNSMKHNKLLVKPGTPGRDKILEKNLDWCFFNPECAGCKRGRRKHIACKSSSGSEDNGILMKTESCNRLDK